MSDIAQKSLALAATQIGVKEDPIGSNWGSRVSDYLKCAGYTSPEPWCMSFVYWCVAHTCQTENVANALPRTGGVHDMWNRCPSLRVTGAPLAGDIGILFESETAGHAFLVESVAGDIVHTIEGNSNTDGSREGYEVVRHQRPISHIHGFLRLP